MVAVKQPDELHLDCNSGKANIKTDSEGSDSGNDQHDGKVVVWNSNAALGLVFP